MSESFNLYTHLRAAFPANLNSTAVECCDGPHAGRRYSFADLERGSAQIAHLLAGLGLPAGARIAVQVEKSVESLLLYLASLRAGLVYLPLNTAYRAGEIEYFLGNAEPAVVVCSPANVGWIAPLAQAAGARQVYTLDEDGSGSLADAARQQPEEHTPVESAADDLAAILYTSGTTGRSKGAMLSHGNLLSNAQVLKHYWGWRVDDVLLHALPVFHVHGLFVACHGALLNGSKMLWFARFDPQAVQARLPEASVFMGVPTLYVRLLESGLNHAACAHTRLFISGSAPMLPDTFHRFAERTGHTILERYGMSETVMLTSNPCHPEEGPRRVGTAGKPLPGVQVRVMNETGQPCTSGETGQVQVQGPNVFAGYWRMPEKTAEEFTDDGWFKTGDVGFLDTEGYLTLVGRSKDLIITGGYNVYPAEVEAALNALPGVAESAVIGVPHPDFGEGVIAVVVPRPASTAPDSITLIEQLKANMAGFKVPKQVFSLTELPRNSMGKVLKNQLRDQYRDVFAAG